MNLKEKLASLSTQSDAFSKKHAEDALTAEEVKSWESIINEMEETQKAIDATAKVAEVATKYAQPATAPAPMPAPRGNDFTAKALHAARSVDVSKWQGGSHEEKARNGYASGMWLLSVLAPSSTVGRKAADWCRENGITKTMLETDNESAGFLVPAVYSNMIIDLRNQYGQFRPLVDVVPMTSDTLSMNRRTGGLTVYYPGEAGLLTASDLTFDQVSLTAKKMATLTYWSSELNEDAVISIAQRIAQEIAYAFAVAEDQAGFNGDGTSTYGGMVGLREKLKGLSGTIANIAGLVVGAGNAYSELTLANFRSTIAKCPTYAKNGASWVMSPSFFYDTVVGLVQAAGGLTGTEIVQGTGITREFFLGYPVNLVEVMPTTEANSQVCALFGNYKLAATLGDRRSVSVAVSEHEAFTTDRLTIRGTQRIDINVHDVGNASATAGLRVPGPVVGLITAAS